MSLEDKIKTSAKIYRADDIVIDKTVSDQQGFEADMESSQSVLQKLNTVSLLIQLLEVHQQDYGSVRGEVINRCGSSSCNRSHNDNAWSQEYQVLIQLCLMKKV